MTLIPTLNGQEEEFCLQIVKKRARKECKQVVEQLVNCTRHKTFSLYFGACDKERIISSDCLSQYTNELALQAERAKLLQAKIQYLKEHQGLPKQVDSFIHKLDLDSYSFYIILSCIVYSLVSSVYSI